MPLDQKKRDPIETMVIKNFAKLVLPYILTKMDPVTWNFNIFRPNQSNPKISLTLKLFNPPPPENDKNTPPKKPLLLMILITKLLPISEQILTAINREKTEIPFIKKLLILQAYCVIIELGLRRLFNTLYVNVINFKQWIIIQTLN